jgi:hypothetical protein
LTVIERSSQRLRARSAAVRAAGSALAAMASFAAPMRAPATKSTRVLNSISPTKSGRHQP